MPQDRLFNYNQDTDPGAVGRGRYWLDTTDPDSPAIKRRNEANSAWVVVGTPGAPGPPGGVDSVNAMTGDVVLDPDDLDDTSTTNKFTTAAEITKLAGIESLADVTDAANVAAAGAVMEADISTASMGFVVDEDDMISNSSTKIPTQQSVKAYVDTELDALSFADIDGSVTDDQVPNTVTLANLTQITTRSHTSLTDIGTNTHAQIDTHLANTSNPHSVTKTQVGLANADNTSDSNKPISTATQTALDAKADLVGGKVPSSQIPSVGLVTVQTAVDEAAQLALTTQEGDVVVRTDENKTYMRNGGTSGTMADFTLLNTPTDVVTSVAGQTGIVVLTKGDVGLGNVDNTSDTNKPVSTATQTALDGKQPLDSDLATIAGLTATTDNVIQSVSSAWASRTPAQLKATLALVKGDVGLGNVDNTSDAAKPVSTATQTALDLKADDSAVVHDTGNETVAGVKTFSSDPLIPDEAYGIGWDGSLEPPTKNSVYDKIETLSPGGGVTNTTTIDFGTSPLSDQSFTVTDAAIATTSKIIASISKFTGFVRSMDEVYADPILFICEPLEGSMTVRAQALFGRVTGTYPIVYSIA